MDKPFPMDHFDYHVRKEFPNFLQINVLFFHFLNFVDMVSINELHDQYFFCCWRKHLRNCQFIEFLPFDKVCKSVDVFGLMDKI